MWTAEIHTELLANVLEQVHVVVFQNKNRVIQRLPHHAQSFALHVNHPPSPFLFRACHGSHHARTFQRRHPLSVMGSSLGALKDTGLGGIDLAHISGSESMMDAVHATVVASDCAGLELDAGSGHKVRSSTVCSVGDTR